MEFLLRSIFRGAALVLLGFLAGCGQRSNPPAAGSGAALTHVVLQTDWFAEPEHGGFYQALAKGYYREAGLDVDIEQGSPSTVPQQMVATGKADFAIGRCEYVIVDEARGVPLVIVGAFMEHDPQAIMVHHESGIRSLKDLDGRNLMAVPGSPFIPIMENILHIKVGVTPSDFGMNRFLADKNFVQQCFLTNEPYYVRQHGAKADVLPISDCGFDPYRVWYARKAFVRDHPEVVRAFGAATLRGWRDFIEGDPAPANAVIAHRSIPRLDPEFMNYSRNAMKEFKLVAGDPALGEAIGKISRERIATQIRQLGEIGLLDHPVSVEEVYDRSLQGDGLIGSPAAK